MVSIKKNSLIDYGELKTFLRERFPEATAIEFDNISIKGESAIGRVNLKLNSGKQQRLWLKIDKSFFSDQERGRQIAEESYGVLVKLYDSFSEDDNLGIIKPVCYIPKLGALVTEEVPGTLLGKIIYRYVFSLNKFIPYGKKRVAEILSKCGEWLAKLQEISASDKELSGIELDFLSDGNIRKDLFRLEEIDVNKNTIEILRDYLFKHLPFVKKLSQKAVGCHVDFSPRNIIIGKNNKITLLDFEKFSYRWPYDNLAIFMVYLDSFRKYLLVDKNKLENLKEFFLKGYKNKTQHNIDEKVLHFFYARYMLIMVANELGFVKKRKPFMRWLILNRMRSILEFWVNKNILR